MLHGADRSRRRAALNERVAKIEVCVKRGETGAAIRYALGPKNRGFDLTSLRIDGEEVTDQGAINEAASSHFFKWFEEPGDAMPGSLGGAKAVWRDAFAGKGDFLQNTAASGVPEGLRAHLWSHFQRRPIPLEVSAAFAASMEVAPTIDEWMGKVKSLPKKSAPGPSGLTYDMVQCWTLPIHEAVLAAHVALWKEGRVKTKSIYFRTSNTYLPSKK